MSGIRAAKPCSRAMRLGLFVVLMDVLIGCTAPAANTQDYELPALRISIFAFDHSANGVVDTERSQWLVDGVPTTILRTDTDEDGRFDWVAEETHNAAGAPLTWKVDDGADGVWDSVTSYTYDSENRRTDLEFDRDGDGAVDERLHFDDPCDAPYEGCELFPVC